MIKLMGESSIGSGVRRVEALVGGDAYRFLAREHVLVAARPRRSRCAPEQLPERVHDIVERLRTAEKEIEKVRVGQLLAAGGSSPPPRRTWRRQRRRAPRADGAGGGDVRTLALDVRGRLAPAQPGVVVVIGTVDGKVSVVAAVNDEARSPRISANALVRAIGLLVGGKGHGGRTTSPRVAAQTPRGSTRRSRWCRARSPTRPGLTYVAFRRTARPRPR